MAKIGIFDSGYGGLTILSQIRQALPEYDYIYLGDNARAPYGSRSFDVIYRYTLEAVQFLFEQECELIILACNTASAKALRTIQQHDLPTLWATDGRRTKRVLGVIRPTVEAICSKNGNDGFDQLTNHNENEKTTNWGLSLNGCFARHIGVLATQGTVDSESYVTELHKIDSTICVTQQACPMWVPLVENGEIDTPATNYFVRKYIHNLLRQDADIDTILLACTHYPLLLNKIKAALSEITAPNGNAGISGNTGEAGLSGQAGDAAPSAIKIIPQGELVANSLRDYLNRHSDIDRLLSRTGTCTYMTTESATKFANSATLFLDEPITALHVEY